MILAAAMLLLAFALFRNYLFGNDLYIFRDAGSDTYNQFWPQMEYWIRRIRSGETSLWLFGMGLGNNINAMLLYQLDPFTLLLLICPDGQIASGLAWIAVLKIFVSGLFAYGYLKEWGLDRKVSAIAALAWAFSGYMILWGQHYWFATTVVYFTMIMYGDQLFRKRKDGRWLVLFLAIQFACNIYTAFWQVIFLAVYAVVLYLLREGKTIRDFGKYLWSYIWRGLLAAMLSACTMFPMLYTVLHSARYSENEIGFLGALWEKKDYLLTLLRLFSNNFLGVTLTENEFGGNYYEQVMLVSSVLAVVFLLHNILRRAGKRRAVFLVMGIVILFSLGMRYAAYFLNLFNYYAMRWSYTIIFLFVVNLAFALQDIFFGTDDTGKQCPLPLTLGIDFLFTLVLLFVAVYGARHAYGGILLPETEAVVSLTARRIALFLVIYGGAFAASLFLKEKKARTILLAIVAGVLCIELYTENLPTLNGRPVMGKDSVYSSEYYTPTTIEAVDQVRSMDNGLYRMEKDFRHGYANDPILENYYGTSSYTLQEKETYQFLSELGLRSEILNATSAVVHNRGAMDMLGIKYLLTREALEEPDMTYLSTIREEGYEDVLIYRNELAFPILYTAEDEFSLVGSSAYLEALKPVEIIEFSEDHLKGQITGQGDLITSIPYDAGWKLYADGKRIEIQPVNTGFVGAKLPDGTEGIELRFVPPGLAAGIVVTAAGVAIAILLLRRRSWYSVP